MKIIDDKLALTEQMSVVTANVIRTQVIERHANLPAEVLDSFRYEQIVAAA
jgi:hypothetical protein